MQLQFGDDGGRKPSDLLQKSVLLFCYILFVRIVGSCVHTHKDSKIMSTCR